MLKHLLFIISIFYFSIGNTQIILTETMGTVSGTTLITTHQTNGGFAQSQWTYSGDADLRSTSVSPGGGANVFITNSPNRFLRMDGLSGTGCSDLSIQFRIWKNGGAGNTLSDTEFLVEVSSDGSNFNAIGWGGHNLGAAWIQTGIISIPTNTIAIRFIQPVVPDQQVRIDDVIITGTGPCQELLLPVTFEHLEAKRQNKNTDIFFSTATEVNNDFFTIERSSDGIVFEAVGTIQGAGNATSIQKYYFEDRDVPSGVLYYRIKQTDFDRRFDYSPVVKVNRQASGIDIFSGRTGGQIFVRTEIENYDLEIISINGIRLYHQQNLSFDTEVFLQNFPSGMCIVRVLASEGIVSKQLIF
jgi:hypothetical protein